MTFEEVRASKASYLSESQKMTEFDAVLGVLELAAHGTMAQLVKGECRIGIRHDMDSDCENAVRMARWEHKHGIRSSYFVLHTDWYYRHEGVLTPLVISCLNEIALFGHEIGLHNNCMAASFMGQGSPWTILQRELSALRKLGFTITGCASHGDSVCHRMGVRTEEMFAEFITDANRELIKPRPMSDAGLEYEAYHIGDREYLSDNGGAFGGTTSTVEQFAEGIKKGNRGVILMHPLYWKVPV